jgi:acetate kinase
MRILTVNAGSSSLKVHVVDDDLIAATYDKLPSSPPQVDAVAHRVVHGGPALRDAVIVDDSVEAELRELTELAPLHQPKSLDALDAARRLLPDVPHVACFDTAFHATLPPAASSYAIPRGWSERYRIRRYGFHGLSHSWASRQAVALVPGARRVVTCHLGAGASLCAVLDGTSVDTTMGFTPVEGLVMATRSGSVDPGLVLWLAEREPDLADVLEHHSGLLGLSGTADMAEVLKRADDGAQLALAVYLHRLRAGIAAMAAALGGLDVCVFTGGVGEHAVAVRAKAIGGLRFLGLAVDDELNASAAPDCDISATTATARTLVVTAREELEMARLARQLMGPR